MKVLYEFENLSFKTFTEKDFDKLAPILSDPEVMSYAYEDCYTEEKTRTYLKDIIGRYSQGRAERASYEFAVYHHSDYVGIADLVIEQLQPASGIGEIGYFLIKESWGKDFATTMARFLINFAFSEVGLHKVTASCNSGNEASRRVMEKCGMSQEGLFKQARFKGGKWDDEYRHAIFKASFVNSLD